MRRIVVILSVLMTGSLASMAQSATDSIPFDTLAADKVVDAISPDTLPADVLQGLIAHLSGANTAVDGVGLAPRRATPRLKDSVLVTDYNDVVKQRILYEYDSRNRNFRTITYNYSDGLMLTTSSKTEKIFDGTSTSAVILTANYSWNNTLAEWVGSTRSETVYDDAHQSVATITYRENTSTYTFWTPTQSDTYIYRLVKNAYQPKEHDTYSINTTSGKLTPQTHIVQDWDDRGNLIEKTEYKGGQVLGVWQNANNDTKSLSAYQRYGTADVKVLDEAYTWSSAKADWIGKTSGKKTYTYTPNGAKVLTTTSFNWNNSSMRYDTASVTTNTYDASGNTIGTETMRWSNGNAKGDNYVTHYISGGKTLADTNFVWSSACNCWNYKSLVTYSYDGSLLDSTNTYSWRGSYWQDSICVSHYFDAKNRDTLTITTKWNGASVDTTAQTKTVYTYNASGAILTQYSYKWSSATHQWTGTGTAYEYTYNVSNKKTQELRFTYSSGSWNKTYERQWTFDAAGHQLIDEIYSWSGSTKTGVSKSEAGYTGNTKTMTASYLWDASRGDFRGVSKTVDTYSGSKKTQSVSYKWNYTTWEWEGMFLYDYSVANQTITYRYDATADTWNPDTKTETRSDANGSINNSYTYFNNAWNLTSQNEMTYLPGTTVPKTTIIAYYTTAGAVSSYSKTTNYYNNE